MKVCIYTDPHWASTSSIFKNKGAKYTKRLDYLIESINWVERLAEENQCEEIFCLGDFFDRDDLNAEEITALNDIHWSSLPHTFLVGNHEILKGDNSLNSINVLRNIGEVVSQPIVRVCDNTNIYFIPYIDEDNRFPLNEVISKTWGNIANKGTKHLILSHNDIKGIRYGAYVSKSGWDIEEIESNCDLFINGHLHNGGWVNNNGTISNKLLNLGNFTGQNFLEDGFRYKHQAIILDTNTLEFEFIENPYAVYFYTIEINDERDVNLLSSMSNRSVVTFRVQEHLLKYVKEHLKDYPNLITYRILVIPSIKEKGTEKVVELQKANHLQKFNDFCIEKMGDLEIVKYELGIVLAGD